MVEGIIINWMSAITAIVLAGGRGNRLGRDKTVEKIGENSMLQRVADSLSLICDGIVIVIAPEQPEPVLTSEAKLVADLYPGKGALGGLYTGLMASDSFYNLVIACDMPFLNPSLLRYIIQVSPGFDVAIPRDKEGRLEPLHALYSRNCLSPIYQQIQRGNLKIDGFLDQVKVRYVEDSEINEFDPRRLSFFNINTSNDLVKARAILEELENP